MSFELIKDYYNLGLFTNDDLEIFASIGWISVEQKDSIINK